MKRNCDYCGKEYTADMRNVKRGWGLCCSKSCAAKKREKSKPDYSPARVAYNNERRANWGKDNYARKRGFPDYSAMVDTELMDDPGWHSHGGVEIAICDFCGLRADYCECGEGAEL